LRHGLISLEVHKDRSTLEDIEVLREDEVIFLSSLKLPGGSVLSRAETLRERMREQPESG